MRDVAEAAGVSRTTVSLVLTEKSDVRIPERTRELVREVARQLGYR
ncbi:MAG: LacI family DNA-binding transcriptional regulator, partial [Microbacterium sp.]